MTKKEIWEIVDRRFKEKYLYPICEHPSYNLVKFLVVCIAKETK